jgi:hypothetical protein
VAFLLADLHVPGWGATAIASSAAQLAPVAGGQTIRESAL